MNPLVTVIVTTRNNHLTLDACLASIMSQTYEPIELIVVDRDSTDGTKLIARYYTGLVYNHGPERSAQRNFGFSKSSGEYVVFIDSDMVLSRDVIRDCVDTVFYHPETSGVIIPEESFGKGFWAQCKRLERSFYHGNDWIEAARFFPKEIYRQLGGFDEMMVSGEDWDLSARAREIGRIMRVNSLIYHNEGRLKLMKSLKKKYYYAGMSRAYLHKQHIGSKLAAGVGPLQRYKLFLSQPKKLFRNPIKGLGMVFMKTCEFAFGGLGYLFARNRQQIHQ
jgi:glycosyltransferase involved in cell wall biosynthesis